MTATFQLTLTPRDGKKIEDIVVDAIRIAKLLNIVVFFTLDGVSIWAYAVSDPETLLRYWQETKDYNEKLPL